MFNFSPYGDRLRTLEVNIVRYRSLEILMVIFYIEAIKNLALQSFQSTDEMFNEEPRIPKDAKNKYKKLWRYLLKEGVLSGSDKESLEKLIEFRNASAHSLSDVFSDLNPDTFSSYVARRVKYIPNSAKLAKELYNKVYENLAKEYIIALDMDTFVFRHVEKTYWGDMKAISNKINRLVDERNDEIDNLEEEFKLFNEQHLHLFHPYHPENRKTNNQISEVGIRKIKKLMSLGYSDLAISCLMRISLVTIRRYRNKFA
ncbi:TPA: hypothetical protein JG809_004858 [Vibrio parahaemolyticus]|uniref:hypothetical protein n=1 Tax=Vibrio parahaemolyticus TaxID=670 RepID=UPI0002DCF94D|nr:hypothetical protein [Vibrio parahaemolyticus]EJA7342767.1 hypothetical protein [Vibrio parahaemolyticus]MBY3750941.1 hypothetical protein [Vibrio parahaemolyticus]MBY3757760.1 hypothetical protein [Vibrio parahaemolyticus]MBY3762669.1 hypothetical protein [Vibrio parahaemolyticus]MBY3772464.1 hypothetical protein [Vibrio parahaemolyticus]